MHHIARRIIAVCGALTLAAAAALVATAPADAASNTTLIGSLDTATFQADHGVTFSGWVISSADPAGNFIDADVVLYNAAGTAGTAVHVGPNLSRSDLAAAYPSAGPNHGFSITVGNIPVGSWNACLEATSYNLGDFVQPDGTYQNDVRVSCRPLTVPAETLQGHIDSVTVPPGFAGSGFVVTGWLSDNWGVLNEGSSGGYGVSATVSVQSGSDWEPLDISAGAFASTVRSDLATIPDAFGFSFNVPTDEAATYRVCVTGSGYTDTPLPLGCATSTFATAVTGTHLVSDPHGFFVGQAATPTQTATWTPAPTSIVTQWSVDGSLRASAPTYTPSVADVGHNLTWTTAAELPGALNGFLTGYEQVALPGLAPVQRVAGADRYSTAVAESQAEFPVGGPTPSVVYVATGENFPDAISAGPAAAKEHAPLLLVQQGSIPAEVVAELQRLHPTQIVLVGGPASVSDVIQGQLGTIAPTHRITGADRFAVSRAVIDWAFGGSAPKVWMASGNVFSDAVSAGAAASAAGEPVLLVNGSAAKADAATTSKLASLGTTSVQIAGGTATVTPGVASSLGSGILVQRAGGVDRFAASLSIAEAQFTHADTVYLASGGIFTDASTGSAFAGMTDGPLILIDGGQCIHEDLLTEIMSLGATHVVILGGDSSVAPPADSLLAC